MRAGRVVGRPSDGAATDRRPPHETLSLNMPHMSSKSDDWSNKSDFTSPPGTCVPSSWPRPVPTAASQSRSPWESSGPARPQGPHAPTAPFSEGLLVPEWGHPVPSG